MVDSASYPSENVGMTVTARPAERLSLLRRVVPVVLVASLGCGLLIVGILMSTAEVALGGVAAILQAPVLAFRDRVPRVSLVIVIAIDLTSTAISAGGVSVGIVAVMIAAFALRLRRPPKESFAWLAIAAVVSTIVSSLSIAQSPAVPDGVGLWVVVLRVFLAFALPLALAEAAITRSNLVGALRERAEFAEHERERRAAEAAQHERTQIARELHDIAAHHLSGIIVGAQAAGALIDRDPEQAHNYVRRIVLDAQHTLNNLRLTVGLLRVHNEGDRAPLPAIDQIPELVDDLVARDRNIEFSQSGTRLPLGPVAEVAAYRMVQESLANAGTHAPGAGCTVIVNYSSRGVQIIVSNTPSASTGSHYSGSGYGLIGMRERAELVNGQLHCGRTSDGGWRNELTIPAPDLSGPSADDDRGAR